MSKVKNPQEKKALSYEKDRRNAYGESDKGSRKSIRKNKRINARSERAKEQKLASIPTDTPEADLVVEIESKVRDETKSKRLKGFRKYPDAPLKEHVEEQKARRIARYGRKKGSL